MARGSSLCLYTDASDSSNTADGPPAGPQAAIGSPLLAREDMVSSAAQAVPRLTMASPPQDGSPVPVRGPGLASRPSLPAALGLATGGPNPLLTECSDIVQHTILSARAPSTRKQYENRWKLFSV